MSGHLCAAGRCAASYGAYGQALVLFRIAGTLLDEAAAVLGPKLEDTAQASSAAQCLSELLIILGPAVQLVCGPESRAAAALYCGIRRLNPPPRGSMDTLEAYIAVGLSTALASRGNMTVAGALAGEAVARAIELADRGAGWMALAITLQYSGDAKQAFQCSCRVIQVANDIKKSPAFIPRRDCCLNDECRDEEPGGMTDDLNTVDGPNGIPWDDVDGSNNSFHNGADDSITCRKYSPENCIQVCDVLESDRGQHAARRPSSYPEVQSENTPGATFCRGPDSHFSKDNFESNYEALQFQGNTTAQIWMVNGVMPEMIALTVQASALVCMCRMSDAIDTADRALRAAAACGHLPTQCKVHSSELS